MPVPGWPGLALPVALVQVLGCTLGPPVSGRREIDALAYLLLLAGPALLVVRARWPVPVALGTGVIALAYLLLGYPYGPYFLAFLVAVAHLVSADRAGWAWMIVALGWAAFVLLGPTVGREPPPTLATSLVAVGWLLAGIVLGQLNRLRREKIAQIARWQAEEHRRRTEEDRRRASDERLRIARELHDVLAHNISLINVQAGVALHLIDDQPEQARTALAAIKQASKETLQELRTTLGVLRQVDEGAPRAPAPGLSRLGDLIERSAAAGVQVTVETVGDPRPLPPNVDLAAFRIVQEALTNVYRHAQATAAIVRVEYRPGELALRVEDDGLGGAGPAGAGAVRDGGSAGIGGPAMTGIPRDGVGNGIPGMRERVNALGGRLAVGPRAGGGFAVAAILPVREPA